MLVGVDTRPLARNAVRRGHPITLVDRFGAAELDVAAEVTSRVLGREARPDSFTRALSDVARSGDRRAVGVVFGAGFENDVLTLSRLNDIGPLLGCSIETVRKTRDPESLMRAGRAWSFLYPDIRYKREDLDDDGRWLVKPFAGLCGDGISFADETDVVPAGSYFQRHVPGFASTAMLVSDGSEAYVLGVAAVIQGDPTFGAAGFQYVGCVFPHPFGDEIAAQVGAIADALTLEFDIRGLWGFDFIYDGTGVTVVSVVPRPPLTLDVLDIATWNDLLGMHIDALSSKNSDHIIDAGPRGRYVGVARVRATEDLIFSHGQSWRDQGAIDLPRDGDPVAKGDHLLTLTAEAATYRDVVAALRDAGRRLYRDVGINVGASSF